MNTVVIMTCPDLLSCHMQPSQWLLETWEHVSRLCPSLFLPCPSDVMKVRPTPAPGNNQVEPGVSRLGKC